MILALLAALLPASAEPETLAIGAPQRSLALPLSEPVLDALRLHDWPSALAASS